MRVVAVVYTRMHPFPVRWRRHMSVRPRIAVAWLLIALALAGIARVVGLY